MSCFPYAEPQDGGYFNVRRQVPLVGIHVIANGFGLGSANLQHLAAEVIPILQTEIDIGVALVRLDLGLRDLGQDRRAKLGLERLDALRRHGGGDCGVDLLDLLVIGLAVIGKLLRLLVEVSADFLVFFDEAGDVGHLGGSGISAQCDHSCPLVPQMPSRL